MEYISCWLGLPDYRNVIGSLLKNRTDITKVMLIYCLNDIYPNLTLTQRARTAKGEILFFLERNSKLYMLLKELLLDRRKAYALHDIKLYSPDNPRLNDYLDVLTDIDSLLKENRFYSNSFAL